MKYVTIATDISSCDKFKITTWACYIRHDGGAIKRVGQFKNYHRNSALAETHALINALVIARKEVPDFTESKVIIHNEIEHVLDPIRTKAGNIRRRDEERAEQIRTIAIPILQQAVDYERRKIKAHFRDWKHSDNPKKYAINRWCDQNSRAELKRLRKEKKRLH
jgi:ribonuclease HI